MWLTKWVLLFIIRRICTFDNQPAASVGLGETADGIQRRGTTALSNVEVITLNRKTYNKLRISRAVGGNFCESFKCLFLHETNESVTRRK